MHFKRRGVINSQRVTAIGVILIAFIAFYALTVNQPGPVTSTTTTSQTTSSMSTSTIGSSSNGGSGDFGTATGIIIPFYINPASTTFQSTLQEILAAKTAFPAVPMIVIINPDSGVGGSKNPTMVTAVQQMQAAHIYVFGYDWTGYGILNTPYTPGGNPYVSLSDIQQNMTYYSQWYGTQGIFFDGMSNNAAYANFYSQLSLYANGLQMQYTVGNPGTDVPSSYIGTVTSMVVYEGATLPAVLCATGSTAPCLDEAWHTAYPKYNFALIGFDQPQLAASYVQEASQYIGWMYITDNTGCPGNGFYNVADASAPCGAGVAVNPYNTLPSYLTAEMAAISSADG